jgi:hypothetical protein
MRAQFLGAVAIGTVCLLAACGKEKAETPVRVATLGIAPSPTATQPPADAQTAVAEITGYEGQIDACALVGREKIEEVLGAPLSGEPWYGISGFPNLKSYCNYNPADVPRGSFVDGKTITFAVLTKEDLAEFDPNAGDVKTVFDGEKLRARSEAGYREIDGLGDDAYFTPNTGLNVLQGVYGLAVHGLTLDQDRQIMQTALDAL